MSEPLRGRNPSGESEQATRAKAPENSLSPLEEQVLSHLATKGSKNIDEAVKEMSLRYEPVYAAFHSLEKREMIMAVGTTSYRGRDYDSFWLTERGLVEALLSGADPGLVLAVVKKTFRKFDDMAMFAQVACRLPERALRTILSLYPSESLQIGIGEILNFVFMHLDLGVGELKTLYEIVRESPHHKEMADEAIKKGSSRFEELKKAVGLSHD